MKKLTKYIFRAAVLAAAAFILTVTGAELTLPVNIVSVASAIFMGVPGIALIFVLNNFIFV